MRICFDPGNCVLHALSHVILTTCEKDILTLLLCPLAMTFIRGQNSLMPFTSTKFAMTCL